VVHAGYRVHKDGWEQQRYQCQTCRHKFSTHQPTSISLREKHYLNSQQNATTDSELLAASNKQDAQAEHATQNLGAGTHKALTEQQTSEHQTQNGYLTSYAWTLQKHGLKEQTIKRRINYLKQLVKYGADLMNPESVLTVLYTERQRWREPTYYTIICSYSAYARKHHLPFTAPKRRYQPKQKYLPTEEELNQLIAASGNTLAAYLQVLKDTGCRAGEANKIRWTELDKHQLTAAINYAEKNSLNRTVRITEQTIYMLNKLVKREDGYIFSPYNVKQNNFRAVRRRLAEKTGNSNFMKISLHSFRHWRGTREYELTGSIRQVQKLLGHRNLNATAVYEHSTFTVEEYIVRRPQTKEDEDSLIAAGYQFIRYDTERGEPVYRKRK
jgi:integrase